MKVDSDGGGGASYTWMMVISNDGDKCDTRDIVIIMVLTDSASNDGMSSS